MDAVMCFVDSRASDGSGAPAPRAGVLVVEDDDDIRESVALVLEDEGYQVDVAVNGRDALALLARIAPPSVALIDLRMPIMDGVQLIEAMRADPRYRSVRLIAFSAGSTAVPSGVPLLKKPAT